MKVLAILSFTLITSTSGLLTSKNTDERFSIIDVLYQNVVHEKWKGDNSLCRNKLLEILKNAQNSTLWASWVLDSIQLPMGVLYGSQYTLGNYDECMKAPWQHTHPGLATKYCLADVQITGFDPGKSKGEIEPYGSTEIYLRTPTKHARKLNTITWGVCVPSVCSSDAVAKILKALLRSSALGSIASDPQIQVDQCQVPGQPLKTEVGIKIFLTLIGILTLIAVTSTWYLNNNNAAANSNSFGAELAKCFCMNRNTFELVKPSGEDIPMLHGVRVMTAMLVTFAHQMFFVVSGAVGNALDVEKDLDDIFYVMHTDLFTDTFLFMSAFLLAKGLVTKEKLENPLSVLWKRYIRLIGPMAVLVFYLVSVSLHAGSGPIWPRLMGVEQQMCAKNWWLSLLMLNNYIRSEEMCFITLWYLPVDYQLTILGVALIYIYRFHRRLGKVTVATITVLAMMVPAVATYRWNIPATIIYNIETIVDIRKNINFNSTYTMSHYRMGSYLVGLAYGTLMAVYKPALHRKYISKKWSIALCVTVFVMGLTPYCMGGLFYTREYDAMEAAIYCATNRIVWAVALGGLVAICEYGDLPIINPLLSWSAWVPLSRLSYGLYLTHPVIIMHNAFTARSPMRHHPVTMFSDSFGAIVLGYIFSLIIWLLVQAPISNLTSYFYRKPAPGVKGKTKEDKVYGNGVSENGLEKLKSL
ncbi:acyltransferase family domain-containing protein [Phthorimaea operculella]|nr:acyltransferase family domain-containing protein [Phthorimaea operculella]